MQNTLVGFTHENGFRVFLFDRRGDNDVRSACTVKADLALIRTYGIQMQELPLLCRDLLDKCEEGPELQSLTFAEGDMRACAVERATIREEAARKRKPWRRLAPEDASVSSSEPESHPAQSTPVFLTSSTKHNGI